MTNNQNEQSKHLSSKVSSRIAKLASKEYYCYRCWVWVDLKGSMKSLEKRFKKEFPWEEFTTDLPAICRDCHKEIEANK